MTKKMLEPTVYSYTITLLSGLHIGGANTSLKIGGIDSSVVKNPLTGAPYIPGSSIKGKMRALLEMVDYSADIDQTGYIKKDSKSDIVKAFGTTGVMSKLIFEDFVLTDHWQEKYESLQSDFFEDKAENSIPRFLKGPANPRHIERVPAGVVFEGRIVIGPREGEGELSKEALEKILTRGIELLEQNYLWGGGSRGSGRIEFNAQ